MFAFTAIALVTKIVLNVILTCRILFFLRFGTTVSSHYNHAKFDPLSWTWAASLPSVITNKFTWWRSFV